MSPELWRLAAESLFFALALALVYLGVLRRFDGQSRELAVMALLAVGVLLSATVFGPESVGGIHIDLHGTLVVLAALFSSRRVLLAVATTAAVFELLVHPAEGAFLASVVIAVVALGLRRLVLGGSPGLGRYALVGGLAYPVTVLLFLPLMLWRGTDLEGIGELLALSALLNATACGSFAVVRIMHEAEEARRNASRATLDFLAAVNHELRTPLTELIGFSEILSKELSTEGLDDLAEHAEAIAAAGADVGDLVSDLSVTSRLAVDALNVLPEETDLAVLVRDVVGRFPSEPIDAPSDGSVVAWADPARTRQVLRNLAANAEEHGGGLRAVVLRREGAEAVVGFVDAGPGLGAGLGERAFDLYETTKAVAGAVPGAGIGLWLARSLTEAMGGEIRHFVSEGHSVFEMRLPAVQ